MTSEVCCEVATRLRVAVNGEADLFKNSPVHFARTVRGLFEVCSWSVSSRLGWVGR